MDTGTACNSSGTTGAARSSATARVPLTMASCFPPPPPLVLLLVSLRHRLFDSFSLRAKISCPLLPRCSFCIILPLWRHRDVVPAAEVDVAHDLFIATVHARALCASDTLFLSPDTNRKVPRWGSTTPSASDLFKIQQEREELFKIQQEREMTYSKSSKREREELLKIQQESNGVVKRESERNSTYEYSEERKWKCE